MDMDTEIDGNTETFDMDHTIARQIVEVLNVASLEKKDTRFANFIATTFQRWNELMGLTGHDVPSPFVTGTSVDGGWSAQFLESNPDPLFLTLEVMQPFVFLRTLNKKDQKLRIVTTEHPELVQVRLLGPDLGDPLSSLRELAEMFDADGDWYLSPKLAVELHNYHAKSANQQQFHIPRKDVYGYFETVLDTVHGPCGMRPTSPETLLQAGEQTCEQDPGGIKSWRDLDPLIGIKINTTPCIQCSGWPEQAKGWPRSPDWPGTSVVRNVRSGGFHLVYTRKDVDPSSQFAWRISFAKPESALMKSWNTTQRQCYLTLLILNRENISKRGQLYVQILKSLMFWQCESYPTIEGHWVESNMANCLSQLLLALRKNIQEGIAKHYFIPKMNLLEGIELKEQTSMLDVINLCLEDVEKLRNTISGDVLGKVASLVDSYSGYSDICVKNQHHRSLSLEKSILSETNLPVGDHASNEENDGFEDTDEIFCIFTRNYLDSIYETFVKVNVSTSKQDKMKAARSRSKFANVLVTLYVLTTAVYFCVTSASTHGLLMVFLLFLVAGLLLNLGWSYRWSLCFIYSVVSINSSWSLAWKVAHFILAFPIAKFIARMMYVFERPLDTTGADENKALPYATLTRFPVVKPGLAAPMLLLYGINLLFLCGSQAHGLRDYWDVFIYTLANHGHFMVFCPWMELFYKDYNSLLVRLKPALCATVCTSLFVMLMLHYGTYNTSFWPWLTMTLLVVLLCCIMCHVLPTYLAIPTYVTFGIMLFLPAKLLYIVMFLLYVGFCTTKFWSSSALSRGVRILTVLCVHLCLQTTSLTAILTSVNMVFGCCMYMGALYSLYKTETCSADFTLLHRISSKLVILTFVVGVAFLAFQDKPASTQEAFLLVSAPVTAAMLLHRIEDMLLYALVRACRRNRVRPGGANH